MKLLANGVIAAAATAGAITAILSRGFDETVGRTVTQLQAPTLRAVPTVNLTRMGDGDPVEFDGTCPECHGPAKWIGHRNSDGDGTQWDRTECPTCDESEGAA